MLFPIIVTVNSSVISKATVFTSSQMNEFKKKKEEKEKHQKTLGDDTFVTEKQSKF